MNKTISINLGGSVFNIEEEAYIILRTYLDSIKANFSGDPASTEIMSDIEVRIAEIFHEKNSDKKNVVTRQDIDEMMSTMGRPEDYRMDDDAQPRHNMNDNTSNTQGIRNPKRKIYRDPDDAVIAGVCSGISHYLGWDPLVVRLLVVFLTVMSIGFPGIIGYIIFWALVPPAVTTGEKLQMRGESVNVENIGRFINQEAKVAGERVNKFGRQAATNIRTGSTDAIRVIGRIFSVFFGIFCFMSGLGLLIGLIAAFAFSEMTLFGFDGNNWDTMNTIIFGNDGTLWTLIIGIAMIMGAPAIALLYAGVKLITRTTKRIKGLGITLLSLFIVGAILCTYGGIKTGRQFTSNAELNNSILIPDNIGDTLHLEVLSDNIFIGRSEHNQDFTNLVRIVDNKVYYGNPVDIHFEPTSSSQFKVSVRRRSNGANLERAGNFARNMEYDYYLSGDSLKLAPHFTTPNTDLYRGQEIDVYVYVPIGSYVTLGKNTSWFTWYHYGDENKTLRMNEDGLEENENHDHVHIDLHEPKVRVTDDSVIIKTGGVEIKTTRD